MKAKNIFTLLLLLTVFGSVNWGFVPSGNNLVERWVPERYVSYVYYAFAFIGLLTFIVFTRMNTNDKDDKDKKN
jgi:uncharacterized membrane protein YuzA (DUF378 family)